MVRGVGGREPEDDADRVLLVGFGDVHDLEAAPQRPVALQVTQFARGGRADDAQLAARQGGLEEVRGVHRAALHGARADDGVQLVHEQQRLAARQGVQHGLDALLEVAPVAGPGEQGAHVEREEARSAQDLRDVPGDEALREALHDGGLADAGLPDEDGVVLRAAREDVQHPLEFLVAAHEGIELVRAGREVVAVRLQGIVRGGARAGVHVVLGDAARAARQGGRAVRDEAQHLQPRHALRFEQEAGVGVLLVEEFREDARPVGLPLGLARRVQLQGRALHDALRGEGEFRLVLPGGEVRDEVREVLAQAGEVRAAREERLARVGVVREGEQEVFEGDVLVRVFLRESRGAPEGLLEVL